MKMLSLFVSLFFLNQIFSEEAETMQLSVLKQYENFSILKKYESFYEKLKPAEENSQQVFAWFSDIPHWLFNAVMHLACEDVQGKVDEFIAKTPLGSPLSFWLHPLNEAEGLMEILKERGFTPVLTCPLMSWSSVAVEQGNWDVRLADLDVFLEIFNTVYSFDPLVKREFENIMAQVDSENYLIYQEGKPIGTVSLLVNGPVGGIFNEATLDDRREACRPMMQFLMKRAHELNLKQLILLSSPEAEPLYQDLGFIKAFDIEIYSR